MAAELHLARSNTDAVSALVASTVNTDWSEGTVCYRYRALPGTEWAYSHSDATCATFGNFGTFVSFGCSAGNTFRTYSYNGYTWINRLDPLLAGLVVEDDGREQVPVLGDRHGGDLPAGRLLEQFVNPARAVEQRVLGVEMKVNELSHREVCPSIDQDAGNA